MVVEKGRILLALRSKDILRRLFLILAVQLFVHGRLDRLEQGALDGVDHAEGRQDIARLLLLFVDWVVVAISQMLHRARLVKWGVLWNGRNAGRWNVGTTLDAEGVLRQCLRHQ